MRDVIEAAFDVGIQGIFVPFADHQKDRCDRVMRGASRPEAVAVGLEGGFPLRLQGKLHQGLMGSI
jgi:hypothetical protein